MKKQQLLATVAAALLITAGVASAQDLKKDEAPGRAPAAQQNAPAEKIAPPMKAGELKAQSHKLPETTGQAPSASEGDKTHATENGSMHKGAMEKHEPGAKSSMDTKNSHDADIKAKGGAAGSASTSGQSTTGQGAASGSAKLSAEHRSKITTIIKQQKVAPANLNVSVSVGTRVPESVHFYPLPVEVVTIYPEWHGYDYILVGSEIVIVDPRTHTIVAILET